MEIGYLGGAPVQAFMHGGPLRRAGAADPDTLARDCDVIFLSLPTPEETRDAIFGRGGLAKGLSAGKILVDRSDGDPELTRALGRELDDRGVLLVDAPISGHYLQDTASPPIILMSGAEQACETVRPLLLATCGTVFYCGGLGNAQVIHLVNSAMSAGTQLATLEVVAMGRKAGLSIETMAEVISKGSGRNRTSQIMLPRLAAGERSSAFQVRRMMEILNRFVAMSARCGAPVMAANVARGLLQATAERFGEGADMDDTVRIVESMANARVGS